MADRLFTERGLSAGKNRARARALGLDLAAFDRCLADPQTDARIDRDSRPLDGADFQGLPPTFVQGTKGLGAADDAVFRDALERAARGEGDRGIPAWLFVALVGLGSVGVLRRGRVRSGSARS